MSPSFPPLFPSIHPLLTSWKHDRKQRRAKKRETITRGIGIRRWKGVRLEKLGEKENPREVHSNGRHLLSSVFVHFSSLSLYFFFFLLSIILPFHSFFQFLLLFFLLSTIFFLFPCPRLSLSLFLTSLSSSSWFRIRSIEPEGKGFLESDFLLSNSCSCGNSRKRRKRKKTKK